MLSDAGAASRDRQKICPHQWFPAPDQWAEGFRQIPPYAQQGPRHLRSPGGTRRRGLASCQFCCNRDRREVRQKEMILIVISDLWDS